VAESLQNAPQNGFGLHEIQTLFRTFFDILGGLDADLVPDGPRDHILIDFDAQITKNTQKTLEIQSSTYVCLCIFVCFFLPLCLLSFLLPLQAGTEFRRELYLM